jgi:hypothetical protein
VQEICEVKTAELKGRFSLTHTLVRHSGGYAFAGKCLGELVDSDHGPSRVMEVRMTGEKMVCFHIFLKRSHGYNVSGYWSLE